MFKIPEAAEPGHQNFVLIRNKHDKREPYIFSQITHEGQINLLPSVLKLNHHNLENTNSM